MRGLVHGRQCFLRALSDNSVQESSRRRFDGAAIDPHDARATCPRARGKHIEKAGLADARDAVHIHHEWPAVFEQLEEGGHLALAPGKGRHRTFRQDVA